MFARPLATRYSCPTCRSPCFSESLRSPRISRAPAIRPVASPVRTEANAVKASTRPSSCTSVARGIRSASARVTSDWPKRGHEQSKCAARDRQHRRLRQHRAEHLRRARAQGRADREFLAAGDGAREHEIRSVRTRDQQNETNRAQAESATAGGHRPPGHRAEG